MTPGPVFRIFDSGSERTTQDPSGVDYSTPDPWPRLVSACTPSSEIDRLQTFPISGTWHYYEHFPLKYEADSDSSPPPMGRDQFIRHDRRPSSENWDLTLGFDIMRKQWENWVFTTKFSVKSIFLPQWRISSFNSSTHKRRGIWISHRTWSLYTWWLTAHWASFVHSSRDLPYMESRSSDCWYLLSSKSSITSCNKTRHGQTVYWARNGLWHIFTSRLAWLVTLEGQRHTT